MTAHEMSGALRQLLAHHVPSMDHVAALLVLRATPEQAQSATAVTAETRLERAVVDRVLIELAASGLVRRDGGAFQYAPPADLVAVVDELAEMNRTKPVTLVRAIYDRPARAAQSFADAFLLRKPEP